MIPLAVVVLLFALPALAQSSSGERLYKGHCANCHSVDGSGSSPIARKLNMRDLRTPEVQSQSDSRLADVITKGRGTMPGHRGRLNKNQVAEVVQYLRSIRTLEPSERASE